MLLIYLNFFFCRYALLQLIIKGKVQVKKRIGRRLWHIREWSNIVSDEQLLQVAACRNKYNKLTVNLQNWRGIRRRRILITIAIPPKFNVPVDSSGYFHFKMHAVMLTMLCVSAEIFATHIFGGNTSLNELIHKELSATVNVNNNKHLWI